VIQTALAGVTIGDMVVITGAPSDEQVQARIAIGTQISVAVPENPTGITFIRASPSMHNTTGRHRPTLPSLTAHTLGVHACCVISNRNCAAA
jgi:hypothetical protein